ncbi:MAG: diacylglycerol O-acyltransferase / wax synthase [Frankiaceae bacterium]|nr:diacylglycerol O-acyltransferase / wax synthase [Frankiaceae bacterium]
MTEQLTGMDAAFLALESPQMPMHVVGVLLLDPAGGEGFSVDRLRQVVDQRLHLMPPFCRRLVDGPLALDKPYWHYESAIELDDHVFAAQVPAPGDLHALGDLVGAIATERLDRSRPLWELHIAGGLADGRVALIAKVHHSTLYGAAGAEFIAELLDLSPEVTEPAERADVGPAPAPPGPAEMAGRSVVAQLRRPWSIARLVVTGGRNAWGTVRSVGGVVNRHGRSALPALAPRTLISGTPTDRRIAAFAAMSLDDAKAVKDAAGVKLNDVVLAVVAMAVRRYLEARDAVPERAVVAGVPVNAGEGESSGTNTLATMLVPLPMEVLDPKSLLTAVHRATVGAKEFTSALGPTAIAELAEITPPAALSVVNWLTRSLGLTAMQPTLTNFIVSNVVGPPIPLYLAGALVDAVFPLGPLLPGAGMNITVLSNLDRLDVGVMACPDLVDDVWELTESMPQCLAELAEAAV